MDNAASVFEEAGTALPSGPPEFSAVFFFGGVRIVQSFSFIRYISCSSSRDCRVCRLSSFVWLFDVQSFPLAFFKL